MKVEILKNCPSCDSLLERVKDQLFCRNPHCGDTLNKKVVNFAKVMKIKGLGDKTVEKLNLFYISDIYELEEEYSRSILGDKLANKLHIEIENSKSTTLAKFIAACSIPLVGQTAGNKLNTIIHKPEDITFEACKEAGLGDKATANLLKWFVEDYSDKLEFIPFKFENLKIKKESTNTVCITGKVPGYTKATLAAYLNKYNVDVVDNLTKKVDYLICENVKNSAKEKKAIELGIPTLTLENFIKEIIND